MVIAVVGPIIIRTIVGAVIVTTWIVVVVVVVIVSVSRIVAIVPVICDTLDGRGPLGRELDCNAIGSRRHRCKLWGRNENRHSGNHQRSVTHKPSPQVMRTSVGGLLTGRRPCRTATPPLEVIK